GMGSWFAMLKYHPGAERAMGFREPTNPQPTSSWNDEWGGGIMVIVDSDPQSTASGDDSMTRKQTPDPNKAAYQRLKGTFAATYRQGRFLAFSEGRVVADAADFFALHECLEKLGVDADQTLVVEAGVEYPTNAVIFL